MLRPQGSWLALAAVGCGALVSASTGCADLFHSTSAIVDRCEIDAAECLLTQDGGTLDATFADAQGDGSGPDAFVDAGPAMDARMGSDAAQDAPQDGRIDAHFDASATPDAADAAATPVSFDAACTNPDAAFSLAARSCAWLGACESAAFGNAFGACLVTATMAFNCEANPNQAPRGGTMAFWNCLANVGDGGCGAVDTCVFGTTSKAVCGGGPSTGGYAACGTGGEANVLAACATNGVPPAGGVSCIATGQGCVTPDLASLCGGGGSCSAVDGGVFCGGTNLVDCANSSVAQMTVDQGYNCADFGAGACATTDAGGAACLAAGSTHCAPTAAVTCDGTGTVATGCPSGIVETIDCAPITGPGTCQPTTLSGAAKVVSACRGDAGCTADTCGDASIVACVQGTQITVPCAAVGLAGRCVADTTFASVLGGGTSIACALH